MESAESDFDPPLFAMEGETAGGRKESWARAPNSPSPGEGRRLERPGNRRRAGRVGVSKRREGTAYGHGNSRC
jgi:hypothetical protein